MAKRFRLFVKTTLTMACAAVPLAACGCDKADSAADRRVQASLQLAGDLLNKGRTEAEAQQNQTQARKEIEQASNDADASASMRAIAKASLAEVEYAAAVASMPQLDEKEAAAYGLMTQIQALGNAIAIDNSMLHAYAGANPAGRGDQQPIKVFRQSINDYKAQLGETDKLIKATSQQIQAKNAQIRDLETKRAAALNEEASLLEQSKKANGRESVDLYKKALAAQAQAADLARQRGAVQVELARLQDTAKEAEKLQIVYQEGIQLAQSQIGRLNEAWKQSQQAMAARNASSKAMLTGPDGIAAKAKELATVLAAAAEIRSGIAETHLEAAVSGYRAAADAAVQVGALVTNLISDPKADGLPSVAAWKMLRQAHSPASYKLARARALNARGSVYLNHKALLEAQLHLASTLTPVMKQAGLALPPELAPKTLQGELKKVAAAAAEDLKDAESLYGEVMDSDRSQAGKATAALEYSEACTGRVSALYAWYHLTKTPKHLEDARGLLRKLTDPNAQPEERVEFPPYPPDLEQNAVSRSGGASLSGGQQPTTPSGAGQSGAAPTLERGNGGAWSNLIKRAAKGGPAPAPAPQPQADEEPKPE